MLSDFVQPQYHVIDDGLLTPFMQELYCSYVTHNKRTHSCAYHRKLKQLLRAFVVLRYQSCGSC